MSPRTASYLHLLLLLPLQLLPCTSHDISSSEYSFSITPRCTSPTPPASFSPHFPHPYPPATSPSAPTPHPTAFSSPPLFFFTHSAPHAPPHLFPSPPHLTAPLFSLPLPSHRLGRKRRGNGIPYSVFCMYLSVFGSQLFSFLRVLFAPSSSPVCVNCTTVRALVRQGTGHKVSFAFCVCVYLRMCV